MGACAWVRVRVSVRSVRAADRSAGDHWRSADWAVRPAARGMEYESAASSQSARSIIYHAEIEERDSPRGSSAPLPPLSAARKFEHFKVLEAAVQSRRFNIIFFKRYNFSEVPHTWVFMLNFIHKISVQHTFYAISGRCPTFIVHLTSDFERSTWFSHTIQQIPIRRSSLFVRERDKNTEALLTLSIVQTNHLGLREVQCWSVLESEH